MYYIYCYTNKINNHSYVGQTNNIDRRKREHYSTSFNPNSLDYNLLFHQKIREYGIDNFLFETLEEVDTLDIEVVNNKEIFWIKEKESYVRYGKGYNLTIGGEGIKRERKISLEDALEIIKMLKEEKDFKEICNKFNINSSYVSSINHGIYFNQDNEQYPIRKYYKKNDDYEELINLLLYSEYTLKEISYKLNLGYSTVKKINQGILRKGLYPEYPIRKLSPQQLHAQRVKELLMIGIGNKEIIEETGVSQETIRRINLGLTNKDDKLIYPLRKPVSTI